MVNKKKSTKISGVRLSAHEQVDSIMDKAEVMKESSKKAMANLREKAMRMNENVEDYIRKNPKKAIGIAAGIGAVVALSAVTMMRKNHDKKKD